MTNVKLGWKLTAGGCAALVLGCMIPGTEVQAAGGYPDEVMLGVFWENDENTTDTLYWSLDGLNFYELAEAYTDATPYGPDSWIDAPVDYDVGTLHDPGILYRDGTFWMISGFSMTDEKLGRRYVPMLGYSQDLVHWSYPGSGSDTNVEVKQLPPGSGKYGSEWDAVAPDFFVDDDGTVWITVCMGYYASWHGDSSLNDIMQPYLIKLESLELRPEADPVNNPAAPPVAVYSDAVPINLPVYGGVEVNNRIDSSFYREGDTYYLCVKKDGVTNEIWKTKTLTLADVQKESNWELVCDDAVTGFEGPSLTKFGGNYYLYTDKLKDYPPENSNGLCGVHVNRASIGTTGQLDEYTGWLEKNQMEIVAHSADGGTKECRHGSVITLTDPAAIKVVWDLRSTTIYADMAGTEGASAFTGKGWYDKESFKGSKYGGTYVSYWYEDNVRQGVDLNNPKYRGKEIYDADSDAWYWMDNVNKGAMAVSKDVYQESSGGKWVRYDQFGKMLKGQVHAPIDGTDEWGYWWFDETTGAMCKGLTEIYCVKDEQAPLTDRNGVAMKDSSGNPAMKVVWYKVDANGNRVDSDEKAAKKWVYYDDASGTMLYGEHEIDGKLYYFDEHDGTAIDGWGYRASDKDCWYEKGERQGYKVNDPAYRGKEIYDPFTDAWYWCDNVQQGAIAKSKDVYQESDAGKYADRPDGTGKWVRYDQWGKMIKGWDTYTNPGKSQYFDLVTGAMAKGEDWINGEHWSFDKNTGFGTRLD